MYLVIKTNKSRDLNPYYSNGSRLEPEYVDTDRVSVEELETEEELKKHFKKYYNDTFAIYKYFKVTPVNLSLETVVKLS